MTLVFKFFLFIKTTPFFRRVFVTQPLIEFAPKNVPKNIYIYWHQGLESAPDVCKECIQSWREMNPDWQVKVLESGDAEKLLIESKTPKNLTLASYSDLLRLVLLQKYGGVWVDSTVLCNKPLDEWLPVIMNQTDFFGFSNPSPDRSIASWFLVAKENSAAIDLWANNAKLYLGRCKDQPKAYFWLHYLYQCLSLISRRFKRSIRQMPIISAQPQHLIQDILHGLETEDKLVSARQSPMQKLSYKHKYSIDEVKALLRKEVTQADIHL